MVNPAPLIKNVMKVLGGVLGTEKPDWQNIIRSGANYVWDAATLVEMGKWIDDWHRNTNAKLKYPLLTKGGIIKGGVNSLFSDISGMRGGHGGGLYSAGRAYRRY